MKIKKLTEDQEKEIPIYRNKWLAVGLSTEKFSNKDAIELCNEFYEVVLKKKKPKFVIAMDSPLTAWLATIFLAIRAQVKTQVWAKVKTQVGDEVWAQVRDQVKNFTWPYWDGHFSSNWIGFYDFFNSVLKIIFGKQKEFDVLKKCTSLGVVYPLDDFCVVSQKPNSILRDELNRLHS